jgi:hypothetical protein
VAFHQTRQAVFVGDDRAGEPVGVDAELGEPAGGLLAAGADKVAVAVDVGQVDQLLAPGQGLFASWNFPASSESSRHSNSID